MYIWKYKCIHAYTCTIPAPPPETAAPTGPGKREGERRGEGGVTPSAARLSEGVNVSIRISWVDVVVLECLELKGEEGLEGLEGLEGVKKFRRFREE